eukprot:TRINITY_DN2557_c0_g1::TRINITY_DN2557_c0_g1_i1::g.19345::m.19345 TRINITY_DN2557_c0_g1::TRINITY_DN2557_c0_g1_i1::g.19345  ORF type:complete len:297 (+),score=32.55,sp/Q5RA17/RRP7A_PONAB/55.81/8e-07,RRP7/PF12923.2/1.1e+03,RRP7/PF12923.2/4.5e-11,RRP7/PF12923.2/7.6e-16,DUF2967/PF11179.3/0.0017,Cortex-I_coil/PF09304.5/0.06,Cortex-I_coil/PF09304.5/4.8e+02,PIN_2/PF10130.4/0.15,PIN_2/PF10130.4/1.2e+04 TRINITY_DN2557_c0_g1_i1:28-891(+)
MTCIEQKLSVSFPFSRYLFCQKSVTDEGEATSSVVITNPPSNLTVKDVKRVFPTEGVESISLGSVKGQSFARGGFIHVNFEDEKAVKHFMKDVTTLQPLEKKKKSKKSCVEVWEAEYQSARPSVDELQADIDEFMAGFDAEKKVAEDALKALGKRGKFVDEDGFVTVRKGAKLRVPDQDANNSNTNANANANAAINTTTTPASKITPPSAQNRYMGSKQNELSLAVAGTPIALAGAGAVMAPQGLGDFYRFQKREVKRQELVTLREKFEEDKKRLTALRAERRARPY